MYKQELIERLKLLQSSIDELKYIIENNIIDEEDTRSTDPVSGLILDIDIKTIPSQMNVNKRTDHIRTIIC
jgi:hypothetical protein|tara:strand:- start:292 stop:504 length:213 start_codon:yes stop_codon:yes gene_type:complete